MSKGQQTAWRADHRLTPPPMEAASDLDRAVFEECPWLDAYVRNRELGEWPAEAEQPATVNATVVARMPWGRLRTPVTVQHRIEHGSVVIIVRGDSFVRLPGIDPRQVTS